MPGGSAINLLRRLLGLDRSDADAAEPPLGFDPDALAAAGWRFSAPGGEAADLALDAGEAPEPEVGSEAGPEAELPPSVACPYCSFRIEPPPPRTRRCPSCRQVVVVRRVDGVTAYLMESVAAVLEAERRREADERAWDAARRHWLHLAVSVQAPLDLCKKVAAMPLSDRAVEAARAVYLTAADQAVREARQAGLWVRLSRIRLAEAEALYADAGSPVPPPADVVALYREAKSAVLQSLSVHSSVAELAGTSCCRACRADDGVLAKIAVELRKPRLPHEGCPRGLCGCDWFVAVPEAAPKRKRRRRAAAASGSDAAADAEAGPDDAAEGMDAAADGEGTIADDEEGEPEDVEGAEDDWDDGDNEVDGEPDGEPDTADAADAADTADSAEVVEIDDEVVDDAPPRVLEPAADAAADAADALEAAFGLEADEVPAEAAPAKPKRRRTRTPHDPGASAAQPEPTGDPEDRTDPAGA